MSFVSIIGSGNVGANAAFFIAEKGVTDVVLVDIQPGLSRGKALDIMEAAPIRRYRNALRGSDSMDDIKGSQMVVLAAGAMRKPGITREELFSMNVAVVKRLAPRVAELAGDAVVVVATEPVDPLTTVFVRESGMPRTRVLGLGGILDSMRFRALVSRELNLAMDMVAATVIGRHTEEMIVLPRYTSVSGVPITHLIPEARVRELVEETRKAGDPLAELASSASSYYAPSAAIAELADSIHMNLNRIFPVSLVLKGEYGVRDAALSLPAVIGETGVIRIITPELAREELEALSQSAQKVALIARGERS